MRPYLSLIRPPNARRGLEWLDWSLIATLLAVTFVAHIAYGANKNALGVLLAAAEAVVLLGSLISTKLARELWSNRRVLLAPAAIYSAILIISSSPILVGNARGLEDTSRVILEQLKLLGLGCSFLSGSILGASRSRGEAFLRLTGLLMGLYAVCAIAAFKIAPDRLLLGPRMMFFDRLTGTFGSANSAATLLGMGLALNAAFALQADMAPGRGRKRVAWWGAAALGAGLCCGGALLLTASRGGFIATACGVAVIVGIYTMLNRSRHRPGLRILGVALAITVVLAIASQTSLGTRLLAVGGQFDRYEIFAAHAPFIFRRLLFGYGAGSFEAVNNLAMTPRNYAALWSIRAMHNIFFQWMEERGLICALLATALVIILLARLMSKLVTDESQRSVRLAVLSVSVVVLVHGLSDFGLENPSIAVFWTILLGIVTQSSRHLSLGHPGRQAKN